MSRLPSEHELSPYVPGFPPGRRWLFLAPHPDDEVFGPGATLAQAGRRGVEVTLVVVTDGAAQGSAAVREGEARAAARELGLPEPRFWRLADRSLDPADRRLQAKLADALAETGPEVVYQFALVGTAKVTAWLEGDGGGVDADIHLLDDASLSAGEATSCVARGNVIAEAERAAGARWVVVDSQAALQSA